MAKRFRGEVFPYHPVECWSAKRCKMFCNISTRLKGKRNKCTVFVNRNFFSKYNSFQPKHKQTNSKLVDEKSTENSFLSWYQIKKSFIKTISQFPCSLGHPVLKLFLHKAFLLKIIVTRKGWKFYFQ